VPDAIDVVVGGDDFDVGDLSRWRVVFRREGVDTIAQAACGHREHAAQLTAAEDADDGTGKDGARGHEVTAADRDDRRPQSRDGRPSVARGVGGVTWPGWRGRAVRHWRPRRWRPWRPARLSASARSTTASRDH